MAIGLTKSIIASRLTLPVQLESTRLRCLKLFCAVSDFFALSQTLLAKNNSDWNK